MLIWLADADTDNVDMIGRCDIDNDDNYGLAVATDNVDMAGCC